MIHAALAVLLSAAALYPAPEPPAGTYLCYFYGFNYDLESSSLTEVRVLPGNQLQIVGETVPFRFDAASSHLTLGGGKFRGATARFQRDSSNKPALVFPRKANEARGHKIDVSDTWCYLEKPS